MGLFKSIGNISEAIKNVTDIIDEAVVDKDKLIEIKAKLAELENEIIKSAQETYRAELNAPMDFRTVQRPLWSFICACCFTIEVISFVISYFMKYLGVPNVIEPMIFPLPINAVITAVVMFYFGGRIIDKNNLSKLI